VVVESALRLDLLVDDLVVVELKSIAKLDTVHEAQLLTYLRFSQRWLGILMNFNVAVLKDGIQRIVRDDSPVPCRTPDHGGERRTDLRWPAGREWRSEPRVKHKGTRKSQRSQSDEPGIN
jgi:hypothetical protein